MGDEAVLDKKRSKTGSDVGYEYSAIEYRLNTNFKPTQALTLSLVIMFPRTPASIIAQLIPFPIPRKLNCYSGY
jgi:hypothetical protein